jgi:hypothetical protein
MKHHYSDYVISKNNFFDNPDYVIELSKSLDYNFVDKSFPGRRTENIGLIDSKICQDFTEHFIKKLVSTIYTKIKSLTIDIRFHKTNSFSDDPTDIINTGWIHTDHELLAGLIYLNPNLKDFSSGTSIFNPKVKNISLPEKIREDFNQNYKGVDLNKYKKALTDYNDQFSESLRVGNEFNRLITYDSNIYHKPNNYVVSKNDDRLTLLFVISEYEIY